MGCNDLAMKMKVLVMITVLLTCKSVIGQTTQEWTQQKKTQIRYLVEQIAALQIYAKYLKTGYDIVQKGHNLIGDIKEDNFNDHSSYFGSLKLVKLPLKNQQKIQLIAGLLTRIEERLNDLYSYCSAQPEFQQHESTYIGKVRDNMILKCEIQIERINALISDGILQMNDEERISRIDNILEEAEVMNSFTQSFVNGTKLLRIQRSKEKGEVMKSRKFSGI